MLVNNGLNVSSPQTRNPADDTATRQHLTVTRWRLLGQLLRAGGRSLRAVVAPERGEADFQRFVGQYGPFASYLFGQHGKSGATARR